MWQRCANEAHPKYARYGGRGIKVCDRWRKFENFLSDMGIRPLDYPTLGRINNDGDYTPTNCRWESRPQQAVNKSNNVYFERDGRRMLISGWAKELGVSVRALYYRIEKHGTIFI